MHLPEQPASSRRGRWSAVVGLSAIFLSTGMMLLCALSWDYSMGKPETPKARRGYFRNGQWHADALTLVAAARWCFEAAPTVVNAPASSNSAPVLVGTNATSVTRT